MNVKSSQDRIPFVLSGPSGRCYQLSVLKRNAQVLRTGSGHNGSAHGSEVLSSLALIGQNAGIWEVVAGKMRACNLDLSI